MGSQKGFLILNTTLFKDSPFFPSCTLRCIATCGSNIKDYEIVKAYGKDDVDVQCSPNNFVLGCGIMPHWGKTINMKSFSFLHLYSQTCVNGHL
jgi:hypothetical protein